MNSSISNLMINNMESYFTYPCPADGVDLTPLRHFATIGFVLYNLWSTGKVLSTEYNNTYI